MMAFEVMDAQVGTPRGGQLETGYDDINYIRATERPYMAYSTVQGREENLGVGMTPSHLYYS